MEAGRVREGGKDKMVALAPPRQGHAFEGKVIGLRTAGGEEDLGIVRADEPRHPRTRFFDGLEGFLADRMQALGVAELIPEKGEHNLEGLGVQRGGGDVIQVDLSHIPYPKFRPSTQTATTSLTSGTSFFSRRSIPIFKVIWDIGQPPQAPVSLTLTTPSWTSTSSTFPPSAIRAGRTLFRAGSVFSFISQDSFP